MNVYAIRHDAITGCYAYDSNTLVIKLETGKDVTAVNMYANDPYVGEFGDKWKGNKVGMACTAELRNTLVWHASVTPEYKRLQYYFEIVSGTEKLYLFEDGIHSSGDGKAGTIVQYFKFAWLNPRTYASCLSGRRTSFGIKFFRTGFAVRARVKAG